ncbi:ABC transporter permease [Anaerosolibacter sp.]|uniref:ABC transporter permease n=1 Tax=Anaerosolibacter sp. TaxID=1872527 RepID=UPI0039EFC004
MKYFKNVYEGRYILWSLASKDLKNRYRRTALGIMWSLLTPLGLVAIIGLVFSVVLDRPLKTFIPFLFSGLMPWLFIVAAAQGGTNAFISAQGYIKQTRTPVEIFPIRITLVEFANLLFSLIAFFIVYLIMSPENFNLTMLLVIPVLMIWLVFGIALATISAIINTYIRDYAPLQSLILQGLFYATPIMWPPDILDEKNYSFVYKLNPIYYMMEIIRKPLLGEQLPHMSIWAAAITITLSLFITAVVIMSKVGRKITFKL